VRLVGNAGDEVSPSGVPKMPLPERSARSPEAQMLMERNAELREQIEGGLIAIKPKPAPPCAAARAPAATRRCAAGPWDAYRGAARLAAGCRLHACRVREPEPP
jgi:hypothetical protein